MAKVCGHRNFSIATDDYRLSYSAPIPAFVQPKKSVQKQLAGLAFLPILSNEAGRHTQNVRALAKIGWAFQD